MLTVWDFVLSPIYLLIIYLIGRGIQKKNIVSNPDFKYYTTGLLVKMFGAIVFCLIYTIYYDGGDTTAYHEAAVSLKKLIFYWPAIYYKIIIGDYKWEYLGYFNSDTGYPQYWRDYQSFMVVRMTSIIEFISFNSYFVTSIILSAISFSGIWKLFRLFCGYYPELNSRFIFTTLFIPSVVFWGSGILKDTYTLTGACWFTYHIHKALILKKEILKNILIALIAGYLVLKIKPYIILSLMPGALLWYSFENLKEVKNTLFKFVLGPMFFSFVLGIFLLIFSSIKGDLGSYSSLESILNKAVATQNDLKQDYNKGNSFDIGEFEPTIPGVIKKFPIAVYSGIFRPSILDAKNIVMVISALENTLIFIAFLYVLLNVGILRFISIVSENPVIFFSLIFSVIFGFSVGLSTSNFGALVRYKIPSTPFFLSGLLMVWYKAKLLYPKKEDQFIKKKVAFN